jgi:hypothetical protein
MSVRNKNRFAFRPAVGDATLEDRLVLSHLSAAQVHAAQARAAQARAAAANRLAIQQVHTAFATQFRAAQTALQQFVNNQVAALFASGRPTAAQLADFNALVNGALNATAFRLSSQFALLPGANTRLIPSLQNGLLGTGANSLASRLTNLALVGRNLRASGNSW